MSGDVDQDFVETLELLRTANLDRLTALRSQGANLEPLAVFHKRLQMLVDHLMPVDSTARVLFEIDYEEEMSVILDQALSELRQAQLAAGAAQRGSGLLLPRG